VRSPLAPLAGSGSERRGVRSSAVEGARMVSARERRETPYE
jgi:hypothetical protein